MYLNFRVANTCFLVVITSFSCYSQVLINEVVATPRQDWSSGGFYNTAPGGTEGTNDEWVELYISQDGLDLTGWVIETDDIDVGGDLTSTGAFDISNYLSLSGGTFTNTRVGDFLILGDVDGGGTMNQGITITLRNPASTIIDQVIIEASSGTMFSGSSNNITDESVSRIPSGVDTDVDAVDWSKTRATLGKTNSPTGKVVINEIVTDPQQDWNDDSFNGTPGVNIPGDNDEWIEFYITTDGLNLSKWTIEMQDTNPEIVELKGSSATVSNVFRYISSSGGSFSNTKNGDYLILGNPSGDMLLTVLLILKDTYGTVIDQVQIGSGAGQANANGSSISNESASRYVNGKDTDTDDTDFIQTRATLGATNSPTGKVVINEVVTDPQQDWETNGFRGNTGAGSLTGSDEWIELFIVDSGINLTGWTLTIEDPSPDITDGIITTSGPFGDAVYLSSSGGTFINTVAGDYYILGNATGEMDDDPLITLKDASGTIIDQVKLGGGSGEAPNGAASGITDESVVRIPNGIDTDDDASDFSKGQATLGTANKLVPSPDSGNGIDFSNGSDDYVMIPDDPSLEMTGDFTIEFWLNTSAIGNKIILEKGSSNTEYSVQQFSGNIIGLNVNSGQMSTVGSYNDGLWHHVAIVYRGPSNGTIYIDGVDDTDNTITLGTPSFSSGALALGNRAGSSSLSIEGIIDEVRIWSDERTQEEILKNMFTTLSGTEAGLVSYYNFDQSNGTTLPDLAGSNDGTLTNMTGSEWTAASWESYTQNTAILQSGGNDVSTGTSAQLTITDITFLNDDNDFILVGHDNDDFVEATTDLPTGTLVTTRFERSWHLTKNDASSNNGNLIFSFDLGSAPNSDYSYYLLTRTGTSGDFTVVKAIGSKPNGNSIEFMIDGAQLTSDNYFTLGRSNTGAGNALDFNGTNDYVSIADVAALDFGSATDFTLETWIKLDGTQSNYSGVLVKASTGAPEFGYQVVIRNDGAGLDYIGVQFASNGSIYDLKGTTDISDDSWHHIALTVDRSTNEALFYVDGTLEAVTTSGAGGSAVIGSSLDNNETLKIGTERTSAVWFNGQMDEARIWSDVRIKQEIQDNMFRTLDVPNESNLVAYYKFDQGIAEGTNTGVDLLTDHSGNNNSGTLTNFALASTASNWVGSTATVVVAATAPDLAGPGNALEFNRTNSEYVSVPYNASMALTNKLTVEAWVYPTLSGATQGLVTRGSTTSGQHVFFLEITNTNYYRFFIYQSNNFIIDVIASTPVTLNEWTHVAGVIDGSNVYLYINGILVNSDVSDGTIRASEPGITLGAYTEAGTYPFSGRLDEVRYWNTARTAAPIQANMFEELNGDETGLKAYYKFDEPVGSTTLPDESTNSNTGTLTNMDAATDWVSASSREPFKTLSTGNWSSGTTWKSGAAPNAATAVLNIKHDIILDGNLSAKMLNIADGVTVTLASGQILSIAGNIINNGSIVGDGTLAFTAGTPMIGGSMSNITINGAAPTLMSNATVTGTLTMTSGNMTLSDYDLTISSGGTLSGGSSTSYFITKNTNIAGGSLIREVANGAGQVVFPIGSNGSYTPFTMLNLGRSASFGVRVFDGTYVNGTSGAAHSSTKEINKTWDVNALGSGFNTTITIQWNLGEEDGSFDRTDMFISKNGSYGFWEVIASNIAANGGGPFQASASGVTSFSQIGGGSGDSPLPVTLTYFYGEKIDDYNALLWQTVTEQDNDYFEIQRADAELAFEAIGKVQGAGDSKEAIDYQFRDLNPASGINYYRLLQVDYDGTETYSEVIMLENTPKLSKWSLYPNPFIDALTMQFEEPLSGALQISLYDINGKLINAPNHESLSQQFTLFFNQLRPGIYFLKVNYNHQTHTERIIKE